IRTCDLCLRSAALYPAELRVPRAFRGRKPRLDQSPVSFNAKLTLQFAFLNMLQVRRGKEMPQPGQTEFTVNDLQTIPAVG
ncbi:MAG: hypothetical protein KDJ69_13440, partial [Nitratireductor sp.]|nr:hypothetical protein [Nitratireductor sp.]